MSLLLALVALTIILGQFAHTRAKKITPEMQATIDANEKALARERLGGTIYEEIPDHYWFPHSKESSAGMTRFPSDSKWIARPLPTPLLDARRAKLPLGLKWLA